MATLLDRIIKASFSRVFPFQGLDPVNKTVCVDGKYYDAACAAHPCGKIVDQYQNHPLTVATTLAGIPNSIPLSIQTAEAATAAIPTGAALPQGGQQSFSNIRNNILYGSPFAKEGSTGKKIFSGLWNVLSLLPKIPFTIVLTGLKLATEFFFDAMANIFRELSNTVKNKTFAHPKKSVQLLGKTVFYGLKGVEYTFHSLYFIGRAITSPTSAAKAAWDEGNKIGGKRFGKAVGSLLAGISAVITAVVYTFALPHVFHVIAGAFGAAHFPSFISNTAGAISRGLSPVFGAIGKGLNFVLKGIGIKWFLSMSPATLGLAAGIGLALPTLGTGITILKDKLISLFHKKHDNQPQPAPQAEEKKPAPEPRPQPSVAPQPAVENKATKPIDFKPANPHNQRFFKPQEDTIVVPTQANENQKKHRHHFLRRK